MKTLGLALGAGAARGTSHIGFLRGLEEAGIKPDFITGCSMGAIVGALYAAGISLSEMQQAMDRLRLVDFFKPTVKRGGLFTMKKIRKILEARLGDLQFKDLEIPFQCVATDLVSRKLICFSKGSVVDAVLASANVPFLFAPIKKDGMKLIDGYILERVPARLVKDMGADIVVAVDALGKRPFGAKDPTALQMALEIMDILECERLEKRKQANGDWLDFWLEPDLGDMGQTELKKIRFACEQGYALAQDNLKKIKKALK
ncbi:MAG: hypothetical protein E7352_01710 [Clostridiales bacterium]|nr:hypothetical protein [Clostridiales bacterium]